MIQHRLTAEELLAYGRYLRQEGRSGGTVDKYLRDGRAFLAWLEGKTVTQESVVGWREHLLTRGYAPVTINSMLAALNGLFRFLDWTDCRGKFLKVQRRLFREPERELTRQEYERLVRSARGQGKERLALLLETICATGIRVSEVRFLTVEAARAGRAEISLKGKIRTILIPGKLARRLLRYAGQQKTASGEIFLTRGGRSLSRKQIWADMKALCRGAGVAATKVFPHNLRHLFARCFYRVSRDLVQLADVLGHSCVETTRIYLISTGAEHAALWSGWGWSARQNRDFVRLNASECT